jgi:beta-carotene ketolase (CrtW type)
MATATAPTAPAKGTFTGVWIGCAIIGSWFLSLALVLPQAPDFSSPWTYLLVLIQTHLYTGLFITAHDAMHGVVAPGRPALNRWIGTVAALLFAYNFYWRLLPKHHAHHQHVATGQDPDFHTGNFFHWYLSFLRQYLSIWQFVLMGITYQTLLLFFPQSGVITYWIVPSILSTLQLFYFGTYLPHRGEHSPENKHFSRSFSGGHALAFLSCYFFGYHYEHHDKPYLPWWKLWQEKESKSALS